MRVVDYEIPAGVCELLSDPPLDQITSTVQENRTSITSWSFSVAGIPVQVFRAQARSQVLERAAAFSQRGGFGDRTVDPERPLIMTGHQPILCHPGIWSKNFAVDRVARRGAFTGLNLIVDSDRSQGLVVSCPSSGKDGLKRSDLRFGALDGATDIPFEGEPAPDIDALRAIEEQVVTALRACDDGELCERVHRFFDRAAGVTETAENLAEFSTFARRAWEGESSRYLEVPISHVATTDAFLLFFMDIAVQADAFARVYNAALDEYRHLHKLRYKANPFPDLVMEGEAVQVPFWYLGDGRRRSLFVGEAGGRWYLEAREDDQAEGERQVLVELDAAFLARFRTGEATQVDRNSLIDRLRAVLREVRPKAITLTIFMRLFVSDLFVHGIGGAKYDTVTDVIVERHWGIHPPTYAVVSASLHLGMKTPRVTREDIDDIDEKLRDLKYNPQRYVDQLGQGTAQAAHLAQRKEDLITLMQRADAGEDVDKKSVGQEIGRINKELSRLLGPVRDRLQTELDQLEKKLEESKVVQFREYPFFLYEPEQVKQCLGLL